MKKVDIKFEQWEATVIVFWDCKQSKAAKYLKRSYKDIPESTLSYLEEENPGQGCCIRERGQSSSVIWLSKSPKTLDGRLTLFHESIHAMLNIMRHWGMELSSENDEVLTSGTGLICRHVLKELGGI